MALVLSGDSPSLSGTYQGGVITSGTAVATTSGTSIDFTSLPTWIKRITVMFNGVSTNGTSDLRIQLGAGSGNYASLRQQIAQNISIGDQVVLFVEVERTDTTSPTNNYLSFGFGAEFSRLMSVPTGVSQLTFAYKATQAATTPTLSIGLSGNPGTVVKVMFRKIFLFINPRRVNNSEFTITIESLPKNITFTGPTLNAYNLSLANLTIASAQNLDTINGGYPGARLSLFNSSSSNAVTVRSTSVSSGNIKLINNNTQALQFGTSTQSISFVYNADGYWYQST